MVPLFLRVIYGVNNTTEITVIFRNIIATTSTKFRLKVYSTLVESLGEKIIVYSPEK